MSDEKTMTKEEKIAKFILLQGERVTKKKKVSKFTADECQAELDRLDSAGHKNSFYQKHLNVQLKRKYSDKFKAK